MTSQSTMSFLLEKVLYHEGLEGRVKLVEERNLELEQKFTILQKQFEEIRNFQKSLGQVDPIEQVDLSNVSSQIEVTFLPTENETYCESNSNEIQTTNSTSLKDDLLIDPLNEEITLKYVENSDQESYADLESSKNQQNRRQVLEKITNNLAADHMERTGIWDKKSDSDDEEIDSFEIPENYLQIEQKEVENSQNFEQGFGFDRRAEISKFLSNYEEETKKCVLEPTLDKLNRYGSLDLKKSFLKNCHVLLKRFETVSLFQKYVPLITKEIEKNTNKNINTVDTVPPITSSNSVFIRGKHGVKGYKCKICKRVLTHLSNLKRHLKVLHKTTDTSYIENYTDQRKGSFNCRDCGKSFRKLDKYKSHLITHKKEKKIPTIKREQKIDIINQAISSSNPKNVQNFNNMCKFCKKKFANFSYLKNHMFTQHAGENLQDFTALCLKREGPKNQEMMENITNKIQDHPDNTILMDTTAANHHSAEENDVKLEVKKYNLCTFCGKNLSNFANLKRHVMSIHPGENLHKCQTCPKTFIDLEGLRKHFLSEHPEGNQTFPCPMCPKLFDSEENLNGHLNRTHYVTKASTSSEQLSNRPTGQNQNIKCELCQESLSKFSDLLKHTCRSVAQIRSKFGSKSVNYKNLHNGLGSSISKKYSNTTQAKVNQSRIKKVLQKRNKTSKPHLKRQILQNKDLIIRPFACKICKKSYSTKWNLKKHQVLHTTNEMPELILSNVPGSNDTSNAQVI